MENSEKDKENIVAQFIIGLGIGCLITSFIVRDINVCYVALIINAIGATKIRL